MTKRITLKDGPAAGKTYLVPDGTKAISLPSGERYVVAEKTGKLEQPAKKASAPAKPEPPQDGEG
jgi:hypothetical protein